MSLPSFTDTPIGVGSSVPFVLGPESAPPVVLPTSTKGRGGEKEPAADLRQLPPKPRNARYKSLDMWRGVACLMLLLYHATFYAQLTFRVSDPGTWSLTGLPLNLVRKCWVGVPLFFVISGYCISASIDSLRRRDHSLWDYFVRRFRRIYPPLWIMCGLTILFSFAMQFIPAVYAHCHQLPKLSQLSLWNWLGNFAAAETWRHNLIGDDPHYLMANTWTLCYEEQFYLVTGVLLAFASRRFFSAAAIVTAIVICVRHVLRACGVHQEGFFCDGHWIMFAVGILIYHCLNYQTGRRRWWTYAVLAFGMLYGVGDRILGSDPVQKHLSEYVCIASFFGLLLILLRRWDDAISGHWSTIPFLWCGKRSYSIYLTHYPLVVVASSAMALWGLTSELAVATIVVPVSLLLALPIAWLYHVTVESRFLNS